MSYSELIETARKYLPPEKIATIEAAYQYAMKAHEGQLRKSGEPYLEHPLHVALTLAELQLDTSSLAAALLHDVPEDCGVPIPKFQAAFARGVARLVDGAPNLRKLPLRDWGEPGKKGKSPAGEKRAE